MGSLKEKVFSRPKPLLAAQALFFLNAAIWLIFGVVSLVRMADNNSAGTITLLVVAVMMFGNAAAMILAGVGLGTGRRFFFYFALALLSVNILLTFTDQFGFFDFATLGIDLVLVGLLVAGRKACPTA